MVYQSRRGEKDKKDRRMKGTFQGWKLYNHVGTVNLGRRAGDDDKVGMELAGVYIVAVGRKKRNN